MEKYLSWMMVERLVETFVKIHFTTKRILFQESLVGLANGHNLKLLKFEFFFFLLLFLSVLILGLKFSGKETNTSILFN